jgi:recombinational DNA repair protein RecT
LENKQTTPLQALRPNENSLNALVDHYKDKMLVRASDTIRDMTEDKQDQFLKRTIAAIIKNDNLKDCFKSNEGKVSIYLLIDDCLRAGLELDKHAYAIPYSKKVNNNWIKEAKLMIKKEGYHAILCGGKKPIFKSLEWGIVYEKEADNVKVDRASGEVVHPAFIGSDPGKIIGVWVQATHINNKKEADFYPAKTILSIRDNHSKTYQDYKAGKKDKFGNIVTSPWITDEPAMILKTAIKAFCKPYADVSEELSSALYNNDIEEEKKDLSSKAEDLIDSAIDRLDPEKEIKKDVVEEVVEENDGKNDGKEKPLF